MPYSSERALILASVGRDADLAAAILAEAKIEALPCKNVPDLVTELREIQRFCCGSRGSVPRRRPPQSFGFS